MDLYNREIVHYEISKRPNLDLVLNMLYGAFKKRPIHNQILLNSDQGFHYKQEIYHKILLANNVAPSMSRRGNCYDNCVIENFFGILKSEIYYNKKYNNITEFIKELEKWIYYYNNYRIKEKLNGLSPVQYRLKAA
mgnify:CR=1 FL=1